MNYTLEALEALGQQLDATSQMALQNRFAIDAMLAPDEGACVLFGEECCLYIPMNMAAGWNFTIAMKKLRDFRNEHVEMMQGGEWGWLTWLFSGSWRSILARIGMVLGTILAIMVLVVCCAFSLIKVLIRKAMTTLIGEYVMTPVNQEEEAMKK